MLFLYHQNCLLVSGKSGIHLKLILIRGILVVRTVRKYWILIGRTWKGALRGLKIVGWIGLGQMAWIEVSLWVVNRRRRRWIHGGECRAWLVAVFARDLNLLPGRVGNVGRRNLTGEGTWPRIRIGSIVRNFDRLNRTHWGRRAARKHERRVLAVRRSSTWL